MPEAFTLGSVLIPTMVFVIVISLLASWSLASILSRRPGIDRGWLRAAVENSAWVGLLGARLGFVITNWAAYATEPWTVFYLWQPGYLWYAGVVAGAVFVLWRSGALAPDSRVRHLAAVTGSFAFGGAVFGALFGAAAVLYDDSPIRKNQIFPDFTLRTLEGGPVTLSSLRGQVVVLNFWATWCAPCRREMPLLDEVYERFQSQGVVIVGIDVAESPILVRGFVEALKIRYPIWLDSVVPQTENQPGGTLFDRVGGVGLPTTFFIDRGGFTRDTHVGELSRALLYDRIEELLLPGRS